MKTRSWVLSLLLVGAAGCDAGEPMEEIETSAERQALLSSNANAAALGGLLCMQRTPGPLPDPSIRVGACAHDPRTTGPANQLLPLQSGCDTCVSLVIALDPYCGRMDWDQVCVNQLMNPPPPSFCDSAEVVRIKRLMQIHCPPPPW